MPHTISVFLEAACIQRETIFAHEQMVSFYRWFNTLYSVFLHPYQVYTTWMSERIEVYTLWVMNSCVYLTAFEEGLLRTEATTPFVTRVASLHSKRERER